MPTTTAATGRIATDLQTVQDLEIEADRAAALIEEFEALGAIIKAWAGGLPDRYNAANFGTKDLTSAVNGVAENRSKAGALAEQLGVLRRACRKAAGLGDQMAAQRAEGDTSAFQRH